MKNQVCLIGHLGSDPEIRYTKNGGAVANFNLATTEFSTGADGQKLERTEWHRIVVWGRLAEVVGKHLSKGRQVDVEGSLRTRSWEDKNGQKHYRTEIHANQVLFLGKNPGSQAGSQAGSQSQPTQREASSHYATADEYGSNPYDYEDGPVTDANDDWAGFSQAAGQRK